MKKSCRLCYCTVYLPRFQKTLMFISPIQACKTHSPPFRGRNALDSDLNYISEGTKAISSYCLLVKTTPIHCLIILCFLFPSLQKKVNFLLSYLNDLTDQNQMLVQTIEDLQSEADGHTSNLVGKQSPRLAKHKPVVQICICQKGKLPLS